MTGRPNDPSWGLPRAARGQALRSGTGHRRARPDPVAPPRARSRIPVAERANPETRPASSRSAARGHGPGNAQDLPGYSPEPGARPWGRASHNSCDSWPADAPEEPRGAGASRPRARAGSTAWWRRWTPSLAYRWRRWVVTVCVDRD